MSSLNSTRLNILIHTFWEEVDTWCKYGPIIFDSFFAWRDMKLLAIIDSIEIKANLNDLSK